MTESLPDKKQETTCILGKMGWAISHTSSTILYIMFMSEKGTFQPYLHLYSNYYKILKLHIDLGSLLSAFRLLVSP